MNNSSKHFDTPFQKASKDPQFDEKNNPTFVINTIAYVPTNVDPNGDSSSEEEEDEEFKKKLTTFDYRNESTYPYSTYKVSNKGRKIVVEDEESKEVNETLRTQETSSEIIHDFMIKLQKTGFDDNDHDLQRNLAVSFGLNGPRSLSSRRNAALLEKATKEISSTDSDISISHEKFFFRWEYPWFHKPKKNYQEVDFETVRGFYKKLKKHNKEWAKHFREVNELEVAEDDKIDDHTAFNAQVPYGLLRDTLKNHQNTRDLIEQFHQSTSDVYFVTMDIDTLDFNGVFSAYTRIYKSKNGVKPKVMSTGYEFTEDHELLEYCDDRVKGVAHALRIASQLDRKARVATAISLPKGVYYPEPNMAILLKPDEETLSGSFHNDNASESPTILKSIFENLSNDQVIFEDDCPIITKTPPRVALYKQKKGDGTRNVREFSKGFLNGISAPNEADIKEMFDVGQSHCTNLQWAKFTYMNRAYTLKPNILIGELNSSLVKLLQAVEKKPFNKNVWKSLLKALIEEEDIIDDIITAAENRRSTLSEIVSELKTNRTPSTPARKSSSLSSKAAEFLPTTIEEEGDLYREIPNTPEVESIRQMHQILVETKGMNPPDQQISIPFQLFPEKDEKEEHNGQLLEKEDHHADEREATENDEPFEVHLQSLNLNGSEVASDHSVGRISKDNVEIYEKLLGKEDNVEHHSDHIDHPKER